MAYSSLQLYRLANKLCIRCGKYKTIKASVNMWKRQSKYVTCEACRKKDRERKHY